MEEEWIIIKSYTGLPRSFGARKDEIVNNRHSEEPSRSPRVRPEEKTGATPESRHT